jgi:UDP-N-acetylglucosamine--N-acetylmuramyl-(pentapeptide) pyrophosphoryl-undecaprenol N-acetylglucosamine transferase
MTRRAEGAPLTVVVAGGGTAGHVEPALAVADALLRRDPTTQVVALGTARGLEARLVPERGYPLELIPAVPVPRRPSWRWFELPTALSAAVRAAADVLVRHRADVLVGFGGYVAAPAYLAARRAGVPYVVHEANARPGWANRLGARRTPFVATVTEGSPLPNARRTGMPLRRSIATLDRPTARPEALQRFGLAAGVPTLLAFGGSQGARRINAAVSQARPALAAAGIQVLHVTGAAAAGLVTGEGEPANGDGDVPAYVRLDYCDRMDLAYAAADLAVCRAGMTTVAELTAVGLPGAYVPLPVGNGEQRLNAEPVVAAGGGLLVDDEDCTAAWVAAELVPLLLDPGRLTTLGRAAADLGVRDADERVADLVLEAAAS